jgi:hypothetical protein
MITTHILVPFIRQMPPKKIHRVAQADTPSVVNVPNSWAGIATWVAGRFGGAAIVALALGYGLIHVYTDIRSQTERMITVLEKRAEVDATNSMALFQLRDAIEKLTAEARVAHSRGQPFTSEK